MRTPARASRRSRSARRRPSRSPASTRSAGTRPALTDGHSYAVDAVATDNVGHTRASSFEHRPRRQQRAARLGRSARRRRPATRIQSYDAAGKKLWLNANQSGSFKLRATASDPHSGISSVTFPALLGTGSNPGTLNAGVYESSTYSFNSPAAPGVKSIGAANGVTNPAAATSSDSIDVEVDGAAPATNPTFPLNNGSYDDTTWNPGCTTRASAARSTDGGSGVAQVNVSIKDRTTGKYWGGSAFDQPTQTFNAATVAGNNWSYALDQSELTSPHSYLVELYSVDNVAQRRVAPADPLHVRQRHRRPDDDAHALRRTHAYLTAGAPYVLYYGTANGGGGFTLQQSATDPSGVDTIAFPDLSGTTGFSGNGGTSTNGSSADPFVVELVGYTFTSARRRQHRRRRTSTRPTCAATSAHDQVTFVLDNSAPTGGSLTVNGGNAYSTSDELPGQPRRLHRRRRRLRRRLVRPHGRVGDALATAPAARSARPRPAVDGAFAGASGTCYRFTLTGTDNVGNVAATSTDVKVDTTAPTQPTRRLRQPLERQHVRQRRGHALLPAVAPAARSRVDATPRPTPSPASRATRSRR